MEQAPVHWRSAHSYLRGPGAPPPSLILHALPPPPV